MRDAIRDYNSQRAADGIADLKILPLCFETLELLLTRWTESDAALYPLATFTSLFSRHTEFVDDLRVEKLLVHELFPNDVALGDRLESREREADNKTLEQLIKDLDHLENVMRQNYISTQQDAVANLIILVFLKVFEEKAEKEGRPNRLRSAKAFEDYRNTLDESDRESKRAIHKLFSTVKNSREFSGSKMFTPNDNLADALTDDFIIEKFIPKLAPYTFLGTRVDALGAVYEVLSERAGKDVKAGQFFTPESVVRFMVKLANLRTDDRILDPACGTGRFLVYAMHEMLEKLRRSDARDKAKREESIRKEQLFGSDIDERIGKLAKMNMWIHGDGKSNIFGGYKYSGLTLNTIEESELPSHLPGFDGAFDAILANPPLGDLNYQAINFVPMSGLTAEEVALERIPILPHKNTLAVDVEAKQKNVEEHRNELAKWQREGSKSARQIAAKQKTVADNEAKVAEIEARLRTGAKEYEITGNTLKGGALFLTAMWHYLKSDAYPDELPEWRGGRLLVILDEGVLNTDDYRATREYLREKFYIKAVISLTRDTFVPISKTATKTSIFYAVKKIDLHAKQKEPIFFGHVARVGLDTKGKATHNDFIDVLANYESFEATIRAAYSDLEFRRERFNWSGKTL